jgi:hypothetical protein
MVTHMQVCRLHAVCDPKPLGRGPRVQTPGRHLYLPSVHVFHYMVALLQISTLLDAMSSLSELLVWERSHQSRFCLRVSWESTCTGGHKTNIHHLALLDSHEQLVRPAGVGTIKPVVFPPESPLESDIHRGTQNRYPPPSFITEP